nr:immunoglobulin light chain junction region [Macaca mulatta]
CLQYNSNPRTF